MKKKTLAVSPTCGPCSMLKSKLAKLGLSVEVKDFSIQEDKEFFIKHQIKSVPRLIVESDGDVTVVQGIDEIIEEIKKDHV